MLVTSTGPDHDKEFTATVVVTGPSSTATGRRQDERKEAELKAARRRVDRAYLPWR